MKIEHIAIWTNDLERLKAFYINYFKAVPGNLYVNENKSFSSYFLTFDTGCRLEIMQMPKLERHENDNRSQFVGLSHFALSVGSRPAVDLLTSQLKKDGFEVIGEPRTTGDGYYESVVLDPDGNRLEITV
ncbi:MAG TPA: VOC family protein [Cyclobacteriaceae bacterium]|nr:VOC family protein [Cyclobacteriaceae bacterium]